MNYSRPPAPKFNWNINELSEETKPQIELQKSDKRRQKQVIQLIEEMILKLSENTSQFLKTIDYQNIQKKSLELLENTQIDKVKSKKYKSVACAFIIHSLRILLIPLRIKEVTQLLQTDERQVRKLLIQLNNNSPFDQDAFIIQYMARICSQIGFNSKFQTLCRFYYSYLKSQNLVQGEHEHIVAAALVLLAGELVFKDKLNLKEIALVAGCCDVSLKALINKMLPHNQIMKEQAITFYQTQLAEKPKPHIQLC